MFDFAEEMYFDEKLLGNKSTRVKFFIRLLTSSAIMASSNSTIFSSESPDELSDLVNLLLHEKPAGTNSNKNFEENVTIADKLSEYKCISTKQHKFLLLKCLN